MHGRKKSIKKSIASGRVGAGWSSGEVGREGWAGEEHGCEVQTGEGHDCEGRVCEGCEEFQHEQRMEQQGVCKTKKSTGVESAEWGGGGRGMIGMYEGMQGEQQHEDGAAMSPSLLIIFLYENKNPLFTSQLFRDIAGGAVGVQGADGGEWGGVCLGVVGGGGRVNRRSGRSKSNNFLCAKKRKKRQMSTSTAKKHPNITNHV